MHWNDVLESQEFWFWYFALAFPASRTEERSLPVHLRPSTHRDAVRKIEEELEGKVLKVPVGSRYSLQIDFAGFGVHHLDLVGPSSEKLELGWVDPQFCSDSFPWVEYEAIIKFLRSNWSGSFKMPYAALLLLHYVAPATKEEVRNCQSSIRQRLIEASLFGPKDADILSRVIFPPDFRLVHWTKDSQRGWIAAGECYSLRHEENEFDHGTLRRFLQSVGADKSTDN
ncbi:MAG TPA: hypothetical protein VKE98_24560 [Gemmataceae bacterium]|nr:hypothetical protein [Gemmataceae bacterium]